MTNDKEFTKEYQDWSEKNFGGSNPIKNPKRKVLTKEEVYDFLQPTKTLLEGVLMYARDAIQVAEQAYHQLDKMIEYVLDYEGYQAVVKEQNKDPDTREMVASMVRIDGPLEEMLTRVKAQEARMGHLSVEGKLRTENHVLQDRLVIANREVAVLKKKLERETNDEHSKG